MKSLIISIILLIMAVLIPTQVTAWHGAYEDQGVKCLNLYGGFTANNWPENAKLKLSCAGPRPGRDLCAGNEAELQPGETFDFDKCNCFTDKCLQIDEKTLPEGCEVKRLRDYCGMNGEEIDAGFHVDCKEVEKPATPEPTPKEEEKEACPVDGQCEYREVCYARGKEGTRVCHGLKNEEGVCGFNEACPANCGDCSASGGKPGDDDDDEDKDDKNPGGGENPGPNEQPKIVNTPSPAQTPAPGASAAPVKTPTPSEGPNRTPGPSAPASNRPSASPQSSPPPAEFSSAMCKCDGIESTPLLPGQLATFTVYGKVEGADTTKAVIDSMTFYMGKSIGSSTQASVIGSPVTVAATPIGGGTGKVRYKATWRQTLPNIVDSNATYRVWAQIKCNKKPTAMGGQTLVMGTQSQNPSSFGQVLGWFDSIFSPNKVVTTPAPRSNVSPTNNPLASTVNPDSLQLKVLKPAVVEKSACSLMTFKFSE